MTVKIIGADFDPKKMHVYDVKTTGRHPVHLIDGGSIITEDDRSFEQSGDMGWFWLNQKDYDYFKSQCKEMDAEVDEDVAQGEIVEDSFPLYDACEDRIVGVLSVTTTKTIEQFKKDYLKVRDDWYEETSPDSLDNYLVENLEKLGHNVSIKIYDSSTNFLNF